MLAGMLSVLLVAGIIGAGVWAANGGASSDAPEGTPTPFAAAPSETESATPTPETVNALPPVKTKRLTAAAKAAGCTVSSPPDEGALHAEKEFTAADYRTNPPASGTHSPTWYEDGIYAPGTTPELGRLVHALEHGRIDVQYEPGTPRRRSRGSSSSSTSSTAVTTCSCSRTGRTCPTRWPPRLGTTCWAAR